MRSLVVLAALWAGLMAATPPASAQPATSAFGRLWCDYEDELVRIAIASGVEGGMGNAAFNFRGTLEILDKAIAEELARPSSMAGIWRNTGSTNKLSSSTFTVSGGAKGRTAISTSSYTCRAATTSRWYGGSYDLTVFDMTGDTTGEGKTVKYSDPINCFAQ